MAIASIVWVAFLVGLLTGSALIYTLIKSYRAAMTTAIGALLNFGVLILLLARQGYI